MSKVGYYVYVILFASDVTLQLKNFEVDGCLHWEKRIGAAAHDFKTTLSVNILQKICKNTTALCAKSFDLINITMNESNSCFKVDFFMYLLNLSIKYCVTLDKKL